MMTNADFKSVTSTINDNSKAIQICKKVINNYKRTYNTVKHYQSYLKPWADSYCKKYHIPQEYFIEILARNILNLHLEKK